MPTVHYVKQGLLMRHGLAPPRASITNRPTAVETSLSSQQADTNKAISTTQPTATTAVGPRAIHTASVPYIKVIVNWGFLRRHGFAPSRASIAKRSTAVETSLLSQQADTKKVISTTHSTAIKAVGPCAIHTASVLYIKAFDGTITPRAQKSAT